jgi:hypothetical protein
MALEEVYRTADPHEAHLLLEQLRAAGIDAVMEGGAQASLFGGGQHVIEQVLLVPPEQAAAARDFLTAQPSLAGTEPSGEDLQGAVCAVHEQPAVATCDRCGAFLCGSCGSLGTPPICESCVSQPEAPRPRPAWAMNLARLYVGSYALMLGIFALLSVGAILWRVFR